MNKLKFSMFNEAFLISRATVKAIAKKDIVAWTFRIYDTMNSTSRMLKRVMERTVDANNARELNRMQRLTGE